MSLRTLNHSAGLMVTTRDVLPDEVSFAVEKGKVTEVAGWGYNGAVPEVAVNPPAEASALHTVVVDKDSKGTRAAIRALVEEHLARYAECSLYSVGLDRELADWLAAGAPGEPVEVPEGDGKSVPADVPPDEPEPEDPEVVEAKKAATAEKVAAARKRAASKSS